MTRRRRRVSSLVRSGDRLARVVEDGTPTPGRASIVLVNGCALSLEHWDAVVDAFVAAGRHVLRVDQPGIGGTRWPRRLPTLRDDVEMLTELIETRTDGPVLLVGHSMAAFVVEALARLHPQLLHGIVVVDGSFARRLPDLGRGLVWAPWLVHRLTRWRPLGVLAGHVYIRVLRAWVGDDLTLDLRRELWRWFSRPEALAAAIAQFVAFQPQADALIDLRARTTMPLLAGVVISATERGQELAITLDAGLVHEERSGHLVMHDSPQTVVDAVAAVEEMIADGRVR